MKAWEAQTESQLPWLLTTAHTSGGELGDERTPGSSEIVRRRSLDELTTGDAGCCPPVWPLDNRTTYMDMDMDMDMATYTLSHRAERSPNIRSLDSSCYRVSCRPLHGSLHVLKLVLPQGDKKSNENAATENINSGVGS